MSYTYYKKKLKYFWNKHFKRSHTFEITAVFNPDFANSSEALIPEPPPPTIRASNSIMSCLFSLLIFEFI